MIGNSAREASNLRRLLTLRSLITLRFFTTFVAYFFVSVRLRFQSIVSPCADIVPTVVLLPAQSGLSA